jgi:hypothetical protein
MSSVYVPAAFGLPAFALGQVPVLTLRNISGSDQCRRQLRKLQVPNSVGTSLFLFAARSELANSDLLTCAWRDGNDREVRLLA